MTRLLRQLLLPFTAVLVLAWAGLVLGQNSQGGSFLPGNDYTVGGVWTWRGNAAPFIFEGTTDDSFKTTLTVTNPTANRAVTLQNAPGFLALGAAVTSGGLQAGTVTLGGANPTSVTTNLTTLLGCQVSPLRSTQVGVHPASVAFLTVLTTAVAGRLDIYAWRFTSSSDPTLIASTSRDVLTWVCIGTR